MDEIRGIIFLLVGVIYLVFKNLDKKKAQQKAAQQKAKPIQKPVGEPYTVPPPLPFDQASPVMPGNVVETPVQTIYQPSLFDTLPQVQEEERLDTLRELPPLFAPEANPMSKQAPAPQTSSRVLPAFSQSTLVQAFVAKEIFSRPPSASRMRKWPGQRVS